MAQQASCAAHLWMNFGALAALPVTGVCLTFHQEARHFSFSVSTTIAFLAVFR